jgi:superfamily II DNA or RNA helicase
VIVGKTLRIGISELSASDWKRLEKKLTYENGQGDVVISYRRLLTRGIYELPRGAWFLMPDEITYQDERVCPPMPELDFTLTLDDTDKDPRFAGQIDAVKSMFEQEQGLVIRPPGTGKTQIASAFAAKCRTRTLVLVHTEDILNQWIESVENAIPELKGQVGVIRGATCKIGHITIATVQTLSRRYQEAGKEWWEQWGCVIADEGHHVSAPTWEAVLNCCPGKYRFAFTASATRADGMHPSMRFIVGPVIHRMKFQSTVKLEVRTVATNFKGTYRGPFDWSNLLNDLVRNEERNNLIAGIADGEITAGNSVLVLSRRIEHLERIALAMSADTEILTGKRSRKDRQRILDAFRNGEISCLLATQLADEALDVQRLNRVLLTHPGKHEGRIIQQIGRALRTHDDKDDAVIFDFVDRRVGVLRRQAAQRRGTYKANKISVKTTERFWNGR